MNPHCSLLRPPINVFTLLDVVSWLDIILLFFFPLLYVGFELLHITNDDQLTQGQNINIFKYII
jgi:hypothetical protein